jgi:hypothetical protein
MRFSIYGLIRLTSIVCMAAIMTGVAVNRMVPQTNHHWKVDFGQPWALGNNLDKFSHENLVLDLDQDKQIQIPLSADQKLELISISPFVNETGSRELVCRRQSNHVDGRSQLPGIIELVRLSFPEMQELDSRPVEWLPNSIPSWEPSVKNGFQTIFSTGAGTLVRVDWTDSQGRQLNHNGQQISWDVPPPFGHQTFITEPEWMTDPRFPNRLLASIWGFSQETKTFHAGLAWLDLNSDRSAIESYGILAEKDLGAVNTGHYYRYPVSKTDRFGNIQIAWQNHALGETGWTTQRSYLKEVTGQNQTSVKWTLGERLLVAKGCMNAKSAFDDSLEYVYFIVPKSAGCYDRGNWQKHRIANQIELVAGVSRIPQISVTRDRSGR